MVMTIQYNAIMLYASDKDKIISKITTNEAPHAGTHQIIG